MTEAAIRPVASLVQQFYEDLARVGLELKDKLPSAAARDARVLSACEVV